MMFSKRIAGIGAVVALVGSALVPSVAFADDDPPEMPVGGFMKVIVDNASIDRTTDEFKFQAVADPCTDDGCKAVTFDLAPANNPVALTAGSSKYLVRGLGVDEIIMSPSDYFTGPGIYQWRVTEVPNTVTGHTVRYSGAEYLLKIFVRNGDYGLAVEGVTTTLVKNDAGEVPTEFVKTPVVFTNVYEDVTQVAVTKHVVNDSGLAETGSYEIKVTFGWPANFDGTNGADSWTGNTPEITVDDSLGSCTANAGQKKTECTVTLAAVTGTDVTAQFTGVPVGATYTVDETTTGNFEVTGEVATAKTVPATGASETVTNTYNEVTPTGMMLEVLPYVLMVGIPLLAIAGYVALRRKMNF